MRGSRPIPMTPATAHDASLAASLSKEAASHSFHRSGKYTSWCANTTMSAVVFAKPSLYACDAESNPH
jgi:hypothetical protein